MSLGLIKLIARATNYGLDKLEERRPEPARQEHQTGPREEKTEKSQGEKTE